MFRSLILALAALGLWTSLVPQVAYPSASSGEPSGSVLVAWPGWAIQQSLGSLSGTVGPFQIWVSAEPGHGIATVWVSLVDAATNEVLRQTTIEVTPAYVPVARTLEFPRYVVREGQRLSLQLQLASFEERNVIFALASPHVEYTRVSLNGVSDSGSGPLAFAHMQTGSGLRAGLLGEPTARVQIVLSALLTVLAASVHTSVASRLRKAAEIVWQLAKRPINSVRQLAESSISRDAEGSPTKTALFLSSPWYPWLAATVPILHFLASNPIHFSIYEAIIPLCAALATVTVSMVILWKALNDWHRSAAAITAAIVIFFAYGHVEHILDYRVDERVLFAGVVLLGVAVIAGIVRGRISAAPWTPFVNLTLTVLLVIPVGSLAAGIASSLGRVENSESEAAADLASHLLPRGLPSIGTDERPDIYYIILDTYARHDALGDFDNSEFLNELRSRHFYVAAEAASNYPFSIRSIPSSLNMAYLDEMKHRDVSTHVSLIRAARENALVAILKDLGYTYVHLRSGVQITDEAP